MLLINHALFYSLQYLLDCNQQVIDWDILKVLTLARIQLLLQLFSDDSRYNLLHSLKSVAYFTFFNFFSVDNDDGISDTCSGLRLGITFLRRLTSHFPDFLCLLAKGVTDLTHLTFDQAKKAFSGGLSSLFVASGKVGIAAIFDAFICGISLFCHYSDLFL